MASSSIQGGIPIQPRARGHDVDALGPSDSSDSGSDVQGEQPMATEADNPGELGGVPSHRDSASDASGTGERATATGNDARDGADLLPDRIIDGAPRDPGETLDAADETAQLPEDDDAESAEDEDEPEAT
ncbi:hypothetical protein HLB44_00850 [Aquincola sp. S2]|uniref:Chemotaxis protein n=1 Tax=Pseudaquabacterium terrae TaxID=2732868 RepID=A0ABX2E9R6_9BURK|nr:hypothetical protein [Aquabacterium terrae]NRF65520.1 hypothetical protein [Aquabacterium terrae]